VKFAVLGPLQIERDGDLVALRSGRQRAVLARLLIANGETVSADRLIQDVWADQVPTDPRNTLQHGVAQLRKLLEPGRSRGESPRVLMSDGTGYRLALAEHAMDADEFEAGLAQARTMLESARPGGAADVLGTVLELWRGQAYEDFAYDEFATAERERLDELRVVARELLLDARLELQGPDAVISDLEGLVAEHPYREGVRARLMRAMYQAGRQAEALQVYRDTAAVLSEELGISPSPELRALEGQILLQDPALAQPDASRPQSNLPALNTRLIGREDDLERVSGFLDAERLVTLLGPGGSGKTRLALSVAGEARDEYADGVWLVRLDTLADPALVNSAVGAVVRMPEAAERQVLDTLISFLSTKRMLLILDNCEHLIETVAELVDRLIDACPQLVILATSQEALNVRGEQRVQVRPLALPDDGSSPFDDLEASPAVELFMERAAAIDPEIDRSPASLNAVANIVRALDGIPLAIELAAARTDLLMPVEIAQRLSNRFQILDAGPRDAPQRQRTLRDAVAWSYGLLDSPEQAFFVHLGVFAGGFDVAAAAAVTDSTEDEALALISRLVSRSLATRDLSIPGTSRYRLLETLRQFGLHELVGAGQEAETRARHAEHYADVALQLDREIMGANQAAAFATFIAEEDNLRAAMDWSLTAGELAPGVRVAARLGRFWDWRGSLAEANTWLGRFMDATDGVLVPELGFMTTWASFFVAELGDIESAHALTAEARRIALEQEDNYALAVVMAGEAMHARIGGDAEGAVRIDEEIRAISRELVDGRWMIAWADNHDVLALLAKGQLEGAQSAAEASLAGFREVGDARAIGWVLTALAQVALKKGDYAAAIEFARESAALSLSVGDGRNAATASQVAADAARASGDVDRAEGLEAEAATLLAARGMPFSPWRRSQA
jgi:predicted ATPase/DNA-binding SARP family transcriptional activator